MRNDSRIATLLRRSLLALAVLGAAACTDETPLNPGGDGGDRPAPESRALGLVEITISDIGSPTPSASAVPVHPGGRISSGASGPSLDLTPAGGDPSGGIQLEPYFTGSFTRGTREDGGVRYVYATFRVRNADQDGNAYGTERTNLTFIAASTAGTIDGTAISRLYRFDGTPAADAIAVQVMPTGGVEQAPGSDELITGPDVLQVFEESELTEVPVMPGVGLLPYGFVVRRATSTTTRTLPESPGENQFDGVVTFAFKIPLQATPAEDPFTVSVIFLAVDDSETRITQSLEEQT
ncbi:MAG TPA: hypothetical protein VF212_07265, partial [Longimicrobiales bacterium]